MASKFKRNPCKFKKLAVVVKRYWLEREKEMQRQGRSQLWVARLLQRQRAEPAIGAKQKLENTLANNQIVEKCSILQIKGAVTSIKYTQKKERRNKERVRKSLR